MIVVAAFHGQQSASPMPDREAFLFRDDYYLNHGCLLREP